MKHLLILTACLLPIASQSQSQNYVKVINYKIQTTNTISAPLTNQAIQSITYYDGLGRPIQQIAAGQSSTGKSLITPIEYDESGVQTKEYLPYAGQQSNLAYDADALTNVLNYPEYLGKVPYSQKLIEKSPIARLVKQAAPGVEWSMNSGKEIKKNYGVNTISDGVKLFKATSAFNSVTGVYDVSFTTATYSEGQLWKDITKDENWTSGLNNTSENYKDKNGRLVMKRSYDNNERHDTYYVYDQYGNLSYVFPPMAGNPATQLDDYCFQFKYDYRNRLIEKKLPGRKWEYLVYDKLDRLVATGPALSPFDGKSSGWIINKYDVQGRIVYTGWYASNGTRKSIQDQVNTSTNLWEQRRSAILLDNISIGYTNFTFPTTGLKLLSINYYDDYSFPNAPSAFPPIENQEVYYNANTKPLGMQTAKWNRLLDGASSNLGELTYTLYDYKSRAIGIRTINYLGGYTYIDSKLDFLGNAIQTIIRHKRKPSSQEVKITERYKYTDQNRLLSHTHQVGNGREELLSYNTYDELGKLVSKKVGGNDTSGNNFLQKIDFSYNFRGWLTEINSIDRFVTDDGGSDLFALSLSYNDVRNSPDPNATPLFNGNISQTSWISKNDNRRRSYTYQYDALNRLRNASYFKNGRYAKSYDESVRYDKNGNILYLDRFGDLDYDSFAIQIDELNYNYKGNLLRSVKDISAHPAGFLDGDDLMDEYKYDGNGNMISDENKGIKSISYNHMNLPIEIVFGGGIINYLYDASGKKIKKTVTAGQTATETEYLSGFQYSSGKLDFFSTAEGYVKWLDDQFYGYVFNYTDHLGNVRMSYGLNPKEGKLVIFEENHYYPFGLKHEKYNSDKYEYLKNAQGEMYPVGIYPAEPNKRSSYQYKYQEQEWQDELGLNIYFFKFRMSDPALGRFLQSDPLAQAYEYNSPYAFAENNVTSGSDLEGLELTFNLQGNRATVQYGPRVTGGVGGNYTLQELRSHMSQQMAREQKLMDLLMSGDGRHVPNSTNLSMPESNINVAKYNNPNLMMADGALIGAEMLSIDAAIGKGLKALSVLNRGRSIWVLDALSRGRMAEELAGANLGWNFPVIDKLQDGVATSIKSLDLAAPSYQKGNNIFNTLKGYINKLAGFSEATWSGKRVAEGVDFTSKTLELVLQPNKGSEAQWQQIFRAIQYALDNNINLVIIFIP